MEFNVIIRNYLRLLRAGAFAQQETIEPMSAWKWGQVVELSSLHHTEALISDGIRQCSSQFFMQMPERHALRLQELCQRNEEARQQAEGQSAELMSLFGNLQLRPILIGSMACSLLYDRPDHSAVGKTELFFPYETQGNKADRWAEDEGTDIDYPDRHTMEYRWHDITAIHCHRLLPMSNKLLGHSLQNIFEEEMRENSKCHTTIAGLEVETLTPTLLLFRQMAQLSHEMLTHGVQITALIDLGIVLRKIGHRIDFVKLQTWIERMKMQRMARLIAQLMTELLDFTEDELPFITAGQKPLDTARLTQEILMPSSLAIHEMSFSQKGNAIFVHASNTSALMWHARRSARFMKYYPSESITNFFTSFTRSLTNIEE